MREQSRDRYLQYDDPIAEHRMLWRAHTLPPKTVHLLPAGVPPTDATRDSQLQSKALPFDSSGTARRHLIGYE